MNQKENHIGKKKQTYYFIAAGMALLGKLCVWEWQSEGMPGIHIISKLIWLAFV